MRKYVGMFLGCLGLVLGFAGVCHADETLDFMRRGLTLEQQGKYKDALLEYRKAIEADRLWSEPHRRIGLVFQTQGRLEEAITEFRQAVRLDSHSALAHNNLGLALQKKGDLEPATEEFKTALRINPRMAEASYNLAFQLYQQNKVELAMKGLDETLKIDSKYAPAHHSMAVALGRLGKWSEAIKSAESAVQYDKSSATYLLFLAWSLYKDGSLTKAVEVAQLAETKDARRAETHFMVGFLETAKHHLDGAVMAYERGLPVSNKLTLRRAIADLRYDLLLDNQTPEANYVLGLLLKAQNEPKEARAAFQTYIDHASTGKWAEKAREEVK